MEKIIDFSTSQGYDAMNLSFSPITGGDGNIEFLLHLRWTAKMMERPAKSLEIVKEAHE